MSIPALALAHLKALVLGTPADALSMGPPWTKWPGEWGRATFSVWVPLPFFLSFLSFFLSFGSCISCLAQSLLFLLVFLLLLNVTCDLVLAGDESTHSAKYSFLVAMVLFGLAW
jgi:hypothetical protein